MSMLPDSPSPFDEWALGLDWETNDAPVEKDDRQTELDFSVDPVDNAVYDKSGTP